MYRTCCYQLADRLLQVFPQFFNLSPVFPFLNVIAKKDSLFSSSMNARTLWSTSSLSTQHAEGSVGRVNSANNRPALRLFSFCACSGISFSQYQEPGYPQPQATVHNYARQLFKRGVIHEAFCPYFRELATFFECYFWNLMVIFSQKRNCVVHICLWINQNDLQILAMKKNRSGFPFCFVARSVLLGNSVHPPYIKPGPAGTWAVTMPSSHCAKKIRFGRK